MVRYLLYDWEFNESLCMLKCHLDIQYKDNALVAVTG